MIGGSLMGKFYSAKSSWLTELTANFDSYPSQGLIRVLKGKYPNLKPLPKFSNALDIGCGNGRNTFFLNQIGIKTTGIEISDQIVEHLQKQFTNLNFEVGTASALPPGNQEFDLIVAWNSIYYMSQTSGDISNHFREIYRVISKKKESRLIMSIPMPSSFIYEASTIESVVDSVEYRIITQDPFNVRIGEKLACFPSLEILTNYLEKNGFENFQIGEEKGDWFGLQYDWWVLVAEPII
jgi:ubiquinone/menaquinone biosynthesis C-methylase UbiE